MSLTTGSLDGATTSLDGGSVLAVTHTDPVTFKQCTFTGHACAVRNADEVRAVLAYMTQTRPWADSAVCPCAWRLMGDEEGCDDHGDLGAGEKLLHLLSRWDVRNVVLVVTRHNSGKHGTFLGSEKLGIQRYRIVLGRAKHVLEQCYLNGIRTTIGNAKGIAALVNSAAAAAKDEGNPQEVLWTTKPPKRDVLKAKPFVPEAADLIEDHMRLNGVAPIRSKRGQVNHWQHER